MQQLVLDIQLPALPTLDNYVVGHNQEALASVRALLNPEASPVFQHIYLWGPEGSGKSHLLSALAALGVPVQDDVDRLSPEAQIALFNQFNDLKAEHGCLVTAGRYAPSQMGLRDDLATRLAWGLVYQLHPLSDEDKACALKQHAQARGLHLPDEVLDYCFKYLRRDLPSLMAILQALDEWSLLRKKPVSVPMLKKLLQGELWE